MPIAEITKNVSIQNNPSEVKLWRRLQTYLRQRRFRFVRNLLATLPRPLQILDVGGTEEFWQKMQFVEPEVSILLYNLAPAVISKPSKPSLTTMVGDARVMADFADQQFPLVFSNSVIEHVGSYQQQLQMAREVRRVGERYCIQTPNRYFPIEPHVMLPFFQFFPKNLKIFILTHFRTPWGWKLSGRAEASAYVEEIRLLNESELRLLFPGARIYKEKFLGLTKSFIVYKGW